MKELVLLSLSVWASRQTDCPKADGTMAPCGPGNEMCSRPGWKPGIDSPAYHIIDTSCGLNDPNGPVYDSNHKLYHLFYQDHLSMPPGFGPVYGHVVSRDLVHWAHVPVAIWNDQPYDNQAIWTGSATIVNGQIVQIYPGLCDPKVWASCPTGTNLAIAIPANASDPLLQQWTKPSYNPIVNGTQRDPTTAWQTPSGEWRLSTFDTIIYGSMDFKTWYTIGPQPGFAGGECPSFFPLPRNTPGAGAAPEGAGTPTHVHKSSHGGDWMNVGTYVANGPKMAGTWTQTPGVPFDEVMIDRGAFYASKDFYDPVNNRRINWGWAQIPPASSQSLPREVTWNPELQQLVYSPLPEQALLRGAVLASLDNVKLQPNQTLSLGNFPAGAGKQAEVVVNFTLPASPGRFGIQVLGPASPTLFFVDYTPGATSVPVGAVTPGVYANVMKDYDLPGSDFNVTDVDYHDYQTCQQECVNRQQCTSWTYVVRGPKYASCCLKQGTPSARSAPGVISGVKDPSLWAIKDVLKLSPSDRSISIRVFVDVTFSEAYWQDGRVAMTVVGSASDPSATMAVTSAAAISVSAQAWQVNSIWVTPEEVLA